MAESSNRFIVSDKPIKKNIQEQQNKKTQAPQTERRGKKSFKEGKYVVSIIDDKEFYQARKCLEARSKRLKKKQGKGSKSNAAEALTDDEVNILYKKYLH